MKHVLTITHPKGFRPGVFDTEALAQAALRIVNMLTEEYPTYTIEPVLDALNGWTPDAAEQMLLRACLNKGNKVAPIKFCRMRAGCGLKEAKDWIDSQMGGHYITGTWTAHPVTD